VLCEQGEELIQRVGRVPDGEDGERHDVTALPHSRGVE
jgi:hypothetical protein